jgi:predicted nuclease of restriction endonuclease-like RecB superfamily
VGTRKPKRKIKSGFEGRAKQLLEDRGLVVGYEEEVLEYTIEANYRPDFKIKNPDGSIIYIEAKGYFDDQDQRKMRAVKDCHPDKDIRMWFQRDCRLPKKKMTCSQWADKYGYQYHIGESFPQQWFKEN